MNYLYYGDNLDVLREHIPTGSVDLVYLDPPFNSDRSYNVLFADRSGDEAQAQIEAFDDTWTWSQESEAAFDELMQGGAPPDVVDALDAMRRLLGHNDVLAYLVMMTQRLIELHRVLKSTGSLYLHCDPSASHYLKVMLDTIFGTGNFVNEIVWHYRTFHGVVRKYFPRKHDTILLYGKGPDRKFHRQFDDDYTDTIDYKRWSRWLKGGNKIYGADMPTQDSRFMRFHRRWVREHGRQPGPDDVVYEVVGQAYDTVWDIKAVDPKDRDRLGYPTQKPEALLERIILSSSDESDVILDPFCGCGTTIAVAERLKRQWIGIDITYIAVDLIDKRLRASYGDEIRSAFDVRGIPRDVDGARALFDSNAFDFERWAVSLVDGQPHERHEQAGDRGVDGWIRFPATATETGRAVVSVKGGRQLNPGMVRDLRGTVESQRAAMGVLVTLEPPTRGMIDEANRSGAYTHPLTGRAYPRLQVVTIPDLLAGSRPGMPTPFLPYLKAKRKDMTEQGILGL